MDGIWMITIYGIDTGCELELISREDERRG